MNCNAIATVSNLDVDDLDAARFCPLAGFVESDREGLILLKMKERHWLMRVHLPGRNEVAGGIARDKHPIDVP